MEQEPQEGVGAESESTSTSTSVVGRLVYSIFLLTMAFVAIVRPFPVLFGKHPASVLHWIISGVAAVYVLAALHFTWWPGAWTGRARAVIRALEVAPSRRHPFAFVLFGLCLLIG